MSHDRPPTTGHPVKYQTVLVCHSQAVFDELEAAPDYEEPPEIAQARLIAGLADGLALALQSQGLQAEIVRLPLRGFRPAGLTRAAFAWRILDLAESNGRPVDMLVCLDFPAWSVRHPRKYVWLTDLPNFVRRGRTDFSRPVQTAAPDPKKEAIRDENARLVAGLLQSERRGLAEAARLLAANRPVAEELARRGLQVEFNPLPDDPAAPPDDPRWQAAVQRLLRAGAGRL